jgi:hypothetical protein
MSRDALESPDEELFRIQLAIRLSKWHKIQDVARAQRRTPRDQAAVLLEDAADRAAEPIGHAA